MSAPLPPQYTPGEVEPDLYRWWMDQGVWQAEATTTRPAYVIMLPPPNVTAHLHMGHGLNQAIQDALIRFERMRGRNVLWLPGTDHAGIATQNVVERLVAAEGKTRFDPSGLTTDQQLTEISRAPTGSWKNNTPA